MKTFGRVFRDYEGEHLRFVVFARDVLTNEMRGVFQNVKTSECVALNLEYIEKCLVEVTELLRLNK